MINMLLCSRYSNCTNHGYAWADFLYHLTFYEGPSESNAYFIMLAHDVRGRCWWYGSRCWTFPPIVRKFCCRATEAGGQSGKMMSDMEVHTKQRRVTEFLHADKIAPTDIQWWLLNVYGHQTVDVSTMRWWVVHFSSGDSDVRYRPCSGRPCIAVKPMKWTVPWSAHPYKLADYDQGTVYGAECWLQCIGNDVDNVGISQSLCHMGPMDAHTGT
jgi:hypothetical protein